MFKTVEDIGMPSLDFPQKSCPPVLDALGNYEKPPKRENRHTPYATRDILPKKRPQLLAPRSSAELTGRVVAQLPRSDSLCAYMQTKLPDKTGNSHTAALVYLRPTTWKFGIAPRGPAFPRSPRYLTPFIMPRKVIFDTSASVAYPLPPSAVLFLSTSGFFS